MKIVFFRQIGKRHTVLTRNVNETCYKHNIRTCNMNYCELDVVSTVSSRRKEMYNCVYFVDENIIQHAHTQQHSKDRLYQMKKVFTSI